MELHECPAVSGLTLAQLRAYAGEPKGAADARRAVADTARDTPDHSARVAMAKLAEAHGHYTDAGKAVWREYLEAGCPAS